MPETCIIIGAGQAAGQLTVSLRSEGFDGRIIMIGEEPYKPYQRPPLSKHYLAGQVGPERVYFRPDDFYEKADVELLLNTRASTIDRAGHTVVLANGNRVQYDKLALATGSRVKRLTLPGADLQGLLYLRTLDDSNAIRQHLESGSKLVVVGGGYIGLEAAAIAVKKGVAVTVLEMEDRLMSRTATPATAEFYRQVHKAAGVEIRTGVRVKGFAGTDGRLEAVLCADGTRIPADCAVIGIGIEPNSELAAAAGLATDNGIVVDDYARTDDPCIVAAGDCTNHPNPRLGRRLRLEAVPNALAQARVAAAPLCGTFKPYDEIPWFWSDQYDLKLQIVGLWQGCDQTIVRGDPAQRSFLVFCFREQSLLAVEAVNNPKEFIACKKLLAAGKRITPEQAADTSVALQQLTA